MLGETVGTKDSEGRLEGAIDGSTVGISLGSLDGGELGLSEESLGLGEMLSCRILAMSSLISSRSGEEDSVVLNSAKFRFQALLT